jgi:hypothetical protein
MRTLQGGDRVSVWLDHAAVGCGFRRFTVLTVGRRWVKLLYLPTLATVDQDRAELERNRTLTLVESDRRQLKRLIRRTLVERNAFGLRTAAKTAKAVLANL